MSSTTSNDVVPTDSPSLRPQDLISAQISNTQNDSQPVEATQGAEQLATGLIENTESESVLPTESVSDSRENHQSESPEESVESLSWWNIAFVRHPTHSINESFFIWFQEETNMAQSFNVEEGVMGGPIVTCEGNPKKNTISQLLQSFCQTIELPIPIPGDMYNGVGVLATVLFKQHEGTKFRNQDYPFAIRGVMPVDPEKHHHLLVKKYGEQPVLLRNFRHLIQVHADEGMLATRGMVNFSVLGNKKFSFVVIAKVDDPLWTQQFKKYPSDEFTAIIGTACYIFHHALAYINDADNHTESAILARHIGQAVYEESTRVVTGADNEPVRTEEEPRAPTPPRRQPKKKKKSKKSKKSKKGGEVPKGEAEEGEEENRVEDAPLPPINVQPPTPKPAEEEELAVATETAPTTEASSTTPPPSLATGFSVPTIMMPVAFCFHSRDDRLTCRLEGCTILANASFPSAVVCPRCTAYSYTRYCSRPHLFADLQRHFVSGECGSTLIPGAVDDTDITAVPDSALPLRPYIQETREAITAAFTKNIIERHRQALYRSMSRDTYVDYFIFDDIDRIDLPEDILRSMGPQVQKQYLQTVRGTGHVCATIELPDNDARKARFTEAVEGCLRLGTAAATFRWGDCSWLFRVIKGELKRNNTWDVKMEEKIAVQMGFEFGWRLPVEWREV